MDADEKMLVNIIAIGLVLVAPVVLRDVANSIEEHKHKKEVEKNKKKLKEWLDYCKKCQEGI